MKPAWTEERSSGRMGPFRRLVFVVALLLLTIWALFAARPLLPDEVANKIPSIPQIPKIPHPRPWHEQETPPSTAGDVCVGARGGRIDDPFTEDLPHPLNDLRDGDSLLEYPVPTYGAYTDIGLKRTWMTFAQRYGPYGYGEEGSGYKLKRVDWSKINWGQLQDQCFLSRGDDVHEHSFFQVGAPPKFRFVSQNIEDRTPSKSSDRHAIVIRTWEGFDYKPEDFWNIRSIITEASLATQGKYTVFLLVDVKRDGGKRIHEDDEVYRSLLEQIVPEEFWDIAVLFHKSLQKSWYPKVDEFSPFWQIMQPLQLFAHFYDDFDTYWQVEMDTRFTGHVGDMAGTFLDFGRKEPYKQSRERSSWSFMKKVHHSFEDFSAKVNKSLKGGAGVWGPVDNGAWGWNPVGSQPPVSNPEDDPFEYGVGENADLLLFSPLSDILRIGSENDWPFRNWHRGVENDVPRLLSFPAQAWASRKLLDAIHNDQHNLGLRVHSEATLPTFALWHGLKIVQVPMPKFQFPERDMEELDLIYNGGEPTKVKDGIAFGPAPYHASIIRFFARPRTFDWQSSLNAPVWMHWMNEGDHKAKRSGLEKRARAHQGPIPDEMPWFLKEVGGEVYAPAFMMHPRKTNKNH